MVSGMGFRAPLLFWMGCVLAWTAAAPGAALGQDRAQRALFDRLERLERDVRGLARKVYSPRTPGARVPGGGAGASRAAGGNAPGGNAPGGNAYAIRIGERLSLLETEVRAATGEVEKVSHALGQITARLDKLVADMDFRLSRMENASAPAGPPGTSPAPTAGGAPPRSPTMAPVARPGTVTQLGPTTGGPVFAKGPGTLGSISQADLDKLRKVQGKPAAGPAKPGGTVRQAPAPAPAQQATLPPVLPEGTPKARYDFARSLLFKTDYVKAARAFEEFLQAHPKNPLATNARYWLGETHYVRHDYRQAARIFLVGFQKAPKGAKAPDTLLKLGMSLVGLKKKTEACATFDKLARDFPNASNTIRRKLGGERKRAGCQ